MSVTRGFTPGYYPPPRWGLSRSLYQLEHTKRIDIHGHVDPFGRPHLSQNGLEHFMQCRDATIVFGAHRPTMLVNGGLSRVKLRDRHAG